MLTTPIGRLRLLGYIEGTSALLLFLVAMPLKYLAGMPEATKMVGMIHGLLFIAYVLMLVTVGTSRSWPVKRLLTGIVAAILPGGPFVFDRTLTDDVPEPAAS